MENEKLDEAIDYAMWMLTNLDPDDMYNFKEVRQIILGMIGYLILLKS